MINFRSASGAVVALILAGTAHAQASGPGAPGEAADASGTGQLEEITVTAQRVDQKLQDVPVSITAFSAATIERLQILSVNDLTRLTPNVKFDPISGGSTGLKPYIRGGGIADGGQVTSESEVSFYVDDVYRARVSAALVDLVELERIEVLRGPQGVLYGRNSSAGAVNLLTRAPTETFNATVQAGYGTWNERRLKGYVSGPISEDGKWRASLNGLIRARDGGRQYDVTLQKKVGKENFQGGQGDVAYVGDTIKGRLSLFYTNTDSDGQYSVPNMINADGTITPTTGSYRRVASPIPSYTHVEQYGATLHLSADYPGGTLTSISGYSHLHDRWRQDFSGGVSGALLGIPGNPTVALFDRISATRQHQFSEEVQAAGKLFDGKIEYVAGVYYFSEKGDQLVDTSIFFTPSSIDFAIDTDSYAGFGQLTWNLTDQLALIGGARYTIDDKKLNALVNGAPVVRSNSYDRFTPKLGVNYKLTPDVLLYASYSEGFKSGGYNGLAGDVVQVGTPFKPQYTKAYEGGVKADLFNRTLRLNVAGFYNKIRNRQNTLTTTAGTFVVENYNVELKGVELEATWRVSDALTVWGNGALNKGKYISGGFSAGVNGSIIDNDVPVFPDYTFAVGFDYALDVGPGKLRFGSDYGGRDSYFSTADNALIGFIPKQEMLNGFVSYELNHWNFQVAGKNLLQEHGWTSGFGFSLVQPRFALEPRTILATARYTF